MTPYPVSNLPAAYGELPCLVEALGSVESRIFPVYTLNYFRLAVLCMLHRTVLLVPVTNLPVVPCTYRVSAATQHRRKRLNHGWLSEVQYKRRALPERGYITCFPRFSSYTGKTRWIWVSNELLRTRN